MEVSPYFFIQSQSKPDMQTLLTNLLDILIIHASHKMAGPLARPNIGNGKNTFCLQTIHENLGS